MSSNGNGFMSKRSRVTAELYTDKIDVCAYQETKLHNGVTQQLVEGYTAVRADRNSNGGGVMLLVRSTISHYRLSVVNPRKTIEAVAVVLVGKGGKKTVLISVYRPPSKSTVMLNDYTNAMGAMLDTVKTAEPKAQIVVAGDMNVNTLNDTEAPYVNAVCIDYGLTQVISEATHEGSCIDHLWVTDGLVVDASLGETMEKKKKSDAGHATIHATIRSEGIATIVHPAPTPKFIWADADWAQIRMYVHSKVLLGTVIRAGDVNEATETFNQVCREAIARYVPVKTSKRRRTTHRKILMKYQGDIAKILVNFQ